MLLPEKRLIEGAVGELYEQFLVIGYGPGRRREYWINYQPVAWKTLSGTIVSSLPTTTLGRL